MTATRALALGSLVAAAFVLAGCGGGGNSSGTTSTETTTATTTTAASGAAGRKLDGSVGPGFDIGLEQGGEDVTTLPPGKYTLTVDDQSSSHNFHLTGPGVDVTTDVGATGTKTFAVTLRNGSYHYQCDPHSSSMKGDFTVSG